MSVEVRPKGLRHMRPQRGVTQRKLASDLGISQNYVSAIDANCRQPGPKVRQQVMQHFGCSFDAMFKVILIDSETQTEKVLQPKRSA